jgi:hypothetical protein
MKVQKIKLSSYDVTWIVLDDIHLPIKPITELVLYLRGMYYFNLYYTSKKYYLLVSQ